MSCRDDINKLPMPASGKRYARRHGKDIMHNFSQYAKAVSDVTDAPEYGHKISDKGVVVGRKLKEDFGLTLGEFLEDFPNLAQALSYAWGARHPKQSWDSEKVLHLKFPENAVTQAEEYAASLSHASLENVATNIENAELLNLTDRPGFQQFDKIMTDLYDSLAAA